MGTPWVGRCTRAQGVGRACARGRQTCLEEGIRFISSNNEPYSIPFRETDPVYGVSRGSTSLLLIEFTETLERVVMVDVLEHKFASSLSGDTGDVDFDFGHVET